MKITPTTIPGVLVIEPEVFGDERGFFYESYQAQRYAEAGIPFTFIQDNHSGSRQGTLRGLHYQIRQPQGKLVEAVSGEIFDVAVDLRKESPSFGQWVGEVLSASSHRQIWIPPGFAHGFYVLSGWAELRYKATNYYAPEWERTLQWDDPQIGIHWPLLSGCQLILSEKDAQGCPLCETESYEGDFGAILPQET